MTPDANALCVFAIKRGDIENREVYCNSLYPFYLSLIEKYKNSPYASGIMRDYVYVNPKTDCSSLQDDDEVSFIPMPNVHEKNNSVHYDLVKYSTVKKGFTVFQRGDLIWAKITPCMQNGKSCLVDDMPTNVGFGSTEFHVIRKRNESIYMPYLWAIFSNENVLKAAQATFSGSAGQQRVSASFIESFPAIIPEYKKQIAITVQLEKNLQLRKENYQSAQDLLNGMNEVILSSLGISQAEYSERLVGAIQLSDLITDCTFSAEYYHPERIASIRALKMHRELTTKKLSEVVSFQRDTVISAESKEIYLGLAGVESQTGELSGIVEEAAGQAFVYQVGDVLYGRLRPYLNKVIVAETSGICSTEFHVMRVIDENEIIPEYLAAIMRSPLILAQTKHMMTGNTHPRISNDDVKNLYIPIPEIDVQREIVSELNKRRKEARKLKEEAEQEWAKAKAQFEKELLGET